ncbi:ankyrin repeat and SOCS box protein 15b isoform X2 [Periophthalmus magnuspinnatus]|uniref:ankyrin repeat and SOCS box protein 15b isoform X2 n=1 Tax=Periophthalmus magnuspinnatus TaxID=409849 RepID=UPI002436B80F|nr:ankyrin repeat and SOCS box protein 15b isoform X2 [Periophthalmus magnuspinnatus]
MNDFEQEEINGEFMEFAIRESVRGRQPQHRKESNSKNFTQIISAIQKGDVLTLQQLSVHQASFRERDTHGWLPLHSAAVHPHTQVLEAVLHASAELTLEELTTNGDTALILAVEAGLVDNVTVLLKHGVSPHNTNDRNESPLLLAVRQKSYEMAFALIMGGAFVEQVCLKKWTAIHEAAKVGCPAILMLLLRHGAKVTSRDGHGVTPLGIAAEHSNTEVLEILIQHGGDVNAQATNGDTVLYDASGNGNLDCIELLLEHGADPNVQSNAFQLPVHRAAYEGHILALRTLLPLTSKRAILMSGHSPVHAAADGGQPQCLQLLIDNGFDVNVPLATHMSENYGDLRRSPLYFAVCNGDITCAQMLLEAGARSDLDPLRCILVAIRAESHTVFPTGLQYCLRDPLMLRLLLNGGYDAHKCFQCCCGVSEELDSTWTDLHNQAYQIYSQPDAITFCEFVSVSWLKQHVVGGVVKMLLDYVSHVNLCPQLQKILEDQPEWEEISGILSSPRSLQHLCRLVIRGHISPKILNNPGAMLEVPLPPRVKNYLTYKEYDLYGDLCSI